MGKPLSTGTISLITAGANLGGQLLNAGMQSGMNRRQLMFSKYMYDLQRKHALEDWQRQADYDSPAKQMERLKAAGLNPHLVYGSGADATMGVQPRSSSVESWNPKAPQFDLGGVMGQYYDTSQQLQSISNMEKQGTLLDTEKKLKESEIFKNLSSTRKIDTDTELGKFALDYKKATMQVMIDQMQADLQKTRADTFFTLSENERKNIMVQPTYDLAVQELSNMLIQKKKMEAETAKVWTERNKILTAEIPYIKQQIENLKSANTMQEIENVLADLGIFKGDPVGARMAALVAAKLQGKSVLGQRGIKAAGEAGRKSAFTGKKLY